MADPLRIARCCCNGTGITGKMPFCTILSVCTVTSASVFPGLTSCAWDTLWLVLKWVRFFLPNAADYSSRTGEFSLLIQTSVAFPFLKKHSTGVLVRRKKSCVNFREQLLIRPADAIAGQSMSSAQYRKVRKGAIRSFVVSLDSEPA